MQSALRRLTEEIEELAICYLGTNLGHAAVVEKQISSHIRHVELIDRIDEMSDRLERDLVNLDEQLLGSESWRVTWDSSIIADLSPYVSDLQNNLSLFLTIMESRSVDGACLFVVDDARLGECLTRSANDNGLRAIWLGKEAYWPKFGAVLRARVSAVKTAINHSLILFWKRRWKSAPWHRLRDCDVLVIDWAEPGCMPKEGGAIHTRNLRRIPRMLVDAGYRVGYVFNPVYWTSPFSRIADTVLALDEAAVMVDDCRTIRQVILNAWRSWRLGSRSFKRFHSNGYDMTELFRPTWAADKVSPQPTLTASFVDVPRKLSAHGIKPKAILFPYENQGWEKVLRHGVREYMPGTKLIAYQFAPLARRYLSFLPSENAVRNNRIPDKMICMGKHYADLFIQRGYRTTDVRIGGTVMFENVFRDYRSNETRHKARDMITCLCASSIKYSETFDLAYKAIKMAKARGDVRVVVNYHPVVDEAFKTKLHTDLEASIDGDLSNVEFSDAQTRDLLDDVDIVFFNTSGSAFEGLVRRVPVVYVPVTGRVSQNKIPDFLKVRHCGRGMDALSDIVDDSLNGQPISVEEDLVKNLGKCMEAVQEEVYTRVLKDLGVDQSKRCQPETRYNGLSQKPRR